MKPINNFENVKSAGGAIENLPAGGYVCEIIKCTEEANKTGKGSHLSIQFDVCEGEQTDFFARDWKAQDREDKYWHGAINQNVPDESSPKYDMQCRFFKTFVMNIEDSNPGYHWAWDEATLKGKKIGVVFGEVEKQSSRGTIYTTTRADSIVSVDAIREGKYKVPAPRTISNATTAPAAQAANYGGYADELPF